MIISHERKFIFIHIGKTGGTSIERALCECLGKDFEETKKDPDGEWWKHIWAKGMKKRVGVKVWNEYFTFAFVRNPYDMILSLYSMYTRYPEYTAPERHPNLFHPWNQYRDFEDFVLAMGSETHEPDDKWRRQLDELGADGQMQVWNALENLQTSYLTESWKGMDGMGEVLVDFVGRFENLEADFHSVCERIRVPKLELEKYGATDHPPFAELYTADMEKTVGEHFAMDIERFGYSLRGESTPASAAR